MPLTIVTVLMPFYKSADILNDAAEKLWITDAVNLQIL